MKIEEIIQEVKMLQEAENAEWEGFSEMGDLNTYGTILKKLEAHQKEDAADLIMMDMATKAYDELKQKLAELRNRFVDDKCNSVLDVLEIMEELGLP